MAITVVVIVVITVIDAVDGFRKAWRTSRQERQASVPAEHRPSGSLARANEASHSD